ncbi:3'-5' exonuclease [Lacticaseibacillus absianus]|uniref:3'-5' exonuclease n=1 Tax=Lacticaseibacillus absianus TaxID=2729623 RepID=UPI0015C6A11A|nr:3'-5' exonuclease [Lacticaseibacillus absianus]
MTLATLQPAVQRPLTATAWPVELQQALQALAQFGGGRPTQTLVTPVAAVAVVSMHGLWPAWLTLEGQRVAAPQLSAPIELEVAPRTDSPADKTIRRLISAYTKVLREPMQLPVSCYPDWPRVRAVFNHLLALQAVCHQLRVVDQPLTFTAFGPLAAETAALLQRGGVQLARHPMMTPWRQAFSPAPVLPAIVIDGTRAPRGRADAGQKADAYRRARLRERQSFARPAHPAFDRQAQPLHYAQTQPDDYTVFDLEFSSGSARQGWFITEIGALRVRGGQIVDAFDRFLKIPPHLQLNSQSQQLTGIDAALLTRYGQPPQEALADFLGFIGEDPLLGFSVKGGDLAVLARQFDLTPAPGRLLDVALLAEAGGPMPGLPEVSLSKYRDYLGLGTLLAHGAIYDAVTTHALYAYLRAHPVAPTVLAKQLQRTLR